MSKDSLNPKQKRFCELYISQDFFGNGVEAYMEAYASKNYNSAKTNASKLLANVSILKYINELLDASGLNDAFVDKQLYWLMLQNQNPSAKIQAIREYNRLKGRYKIDSDTSSAAITSTGFTVKNKPRAFLLTNAE